MPGATTTVSRSALNPDSYPSRLETEGITVAARYKGELVCPDRPAKKGEFLVDIFLELERAKSKLTFAFPDELSARTFQQVAPPEIGSLAWGAYKADMPRVP